MCGPPATICITTLRTEDKRERGNEGSRSLACLMGLFDFLVRLLTGGGRRGDESVSTGTRRRRSRSRRTPVRLQPLRYRAQRAEARRQRRSDASSYLLASGSPYRFARFGVRFRQYLDLSRDADVDSLAQRGLPEFHTPEQLADWLELPVGKVAWLTHHFSGTGRPEHVQKSHYHYRWVSKRRGGSRLIEAPKATLKNAQTKILRGILDRVPPHSAAHGFVRGRSIVSNALPHVGRQVLVTFDLENFYATVTFPRVAAIFRGIGYSREAAIWLAGLTTSALPPNVPPPAGDAAALVPYLSRHLPQGAPTSPALANLSAFSLDVRLAGLSRSYGAAYTRYADDLTFSGPRGLIRALPTFIPLVTAIVRDERFRVNRRKRKVIRDNGRQTVTGIVVNQRTNIVRRDYDRLKAILTNCLRHGPASQNRDGHADFPAHLRGRIAHVQQLNRPRGDKLLEIYRQIRW